MITGSIHKIEADPRDRIVLRRKLINAVKEGNREEVKAISHQINVLDFILVLQGKIPAPHDYHERCGYVFQYFLMRSSRVDRDEDDQKKDEVSEI